MNVLIINPILFTADNDIIPKVKSIKDSMIYNFALGFKQNGHQVTLYAAEDYNQQILKPLTSMLYLEKQV